MGTEAAERVGIGSFLCLLQKSAALCDTSLPYAGTLALFLGKLLILKHTQKTLLAKQWLSLFFVFFFFAIRILIFCSCCTGLMASCSKKDPTHTSSSQNSKSKNKTQQPVQVS